MKIKYHSTYPQHKREHSRALAVPLSCPMKGDGEHARYALHDRYGNLRSTERAWLVKARYLDWMEGK